MREIKFRAWIKPIKEVRLVNGIEFDSYSNPFVVSDTKHEAWYADEFELMQYTGLTDENGREIYEGDVVRRDYVVGHAVHDPVSLGVVDYEIKKEGRYIGVVHYRPSAGFILNSCRHYTIDGDFIENLSGIKIYPDYSEVIGNIYENPELLEEE